MLKNCQACGELISDKAIECVKCGSKEPFTKEKIRECPECTANISVDSKVCPKCGFPEPFERDEVTDKKQNTTIQDIDTSIDSEEFKEYVQAYIDTPSKTEHYLKTFEKYQRNENLFTWSWSWWAFLAPGLYLIYRKVYTIGLSIFLFQSILSVFIIFNMSLQPLGFVLSVIAGGSLQYFIYKRFNKIYSSLEALEHHQKIQQLKIHGGTDKKAAILTVVAMAILMYGSMFYFFSVVGLFDT